MRLYLLSLTFFLLATTIALAASPSFTVNMSEAVTVTGTPRIAVDVGGVTRYADYTSGSGSSALTFTYQIVSGDVDSDGVTLMSPIDLNGGSIKDLNGNDATLVFTVPDTSGIKIDATAPAAYSATFTDRTVTNINKTNIGFTLTYDKPNRTYNYTISSSGGGTPLTGSGLTTGATQTISGLNLTSLPDGKLTLSVILTDSLGGTGPTATDTIPMVALDNSLVGYWTLDPNDLSATTAYDRSGQGNNGTLMNGPSQITGSVGGALSFDGVNDYIEVPYTPILNPAQFTVSLWAKVTGGAGTWRSPITSRNTGMGYLMYASTLDNWQTWTGSNPPAAWNPLSGTGIVLGSWIHLVASYNGSTFSLYQNGTLSSSAVKPYNQNTSRPLRIGGGSTEGSTMYFMLGDVDDVRVYNRALSATEIQEIYNIEH